PRTTTSRAAIEHNRRAVVAALHPAPTLAMPADDRHVMQRGRSQPGPASRSATVAGQAGGQQPLGVGVRVAAGRAPPQPRGRDAPAGALDRRPPGARRRCPASAGPPFTPTRRRTLASTGGHPVTQRGRPPTRWTRGHTDRGTDTPPALRAPAALLTTARAAPPFTRQVPDSAAPASGRPSPTRPSADYVDRSARRLARRRRGDTRLAPAGAATRQSTLAAAPGARPGTAAGPDRPPVGGGLSQPDREIYVLGVVAEVGPELPLGLNLGRTRHHARVADPHARRPLSCHLRRVTTGCARQECLLEASHSGGGRAGSGPSRLAQRPPTADHDSAERRPSTAVAALATAALRGATIGRGRQASPIASDREAVPDRQADCRVRSPAASRSDRRRPTTTRAATETRAPRAASMRNGR